MRNHTVLNKNLIQMTFVFEKNYMYVQTFNLESWETEKKIRGKLVDFDLKPYKMYVNCVKNKNMENLGYSYIWISNEEAFNLLVGLNQDGSDRVEYIPDPSWEKEEVKEEKKEGEKFLWSDECEDKAPLIEKILDPLIDFGDEIIIKESFIINHYDRENIIYTKS